MTNTTREWREDLLAGLRRARADFVDRAVAEADPTYRQAAWAVMEPAAGGLTIASPVNTEPICRVSGYLQPVVGNARFIARARTLLPQLADAVEQEHAEVVRLCVAMLTVVGTPEAERIFSVSNASRNDAARRYFGEVKGG